MLTADKTTTLGSVTVKEYLLTKHNPNGIAMPTTSMEGRIMGVTVHNTDWITVSPETTPAEQYTRATVNGNMNDVRVHYYVDDKCAWQNLPHALSGWHAADNSGNGNRCTIAIECIMSNAYNANDKASEDNCARLAAALLKQYGLGIEHLYTHTHWLNVKDGKSGTVDQLNTMHNNYKMCPLYILPHWAAFKAKVAGYMGETAEAPQEATEADDKPYRIRKSKDDVSSQIGAYSSFTNAIRAWKEGYTVFDKDGNALYPEHEKNEFQVRVDIPDLNIRTGPGMQYLKTGHFTGKGIFTIVEVQGSWGRLKSGAGWISMNYAAKI